VYIDIVRKSKNILNCLSKNLNGYESTCWLKSENELLGGKSPADMMMEGKGREVEKILPKEMKRLKSKKK
jgi:hypothetical protein